LVYGMVDVSSFATFDVDVGAFDSIFGNVFE